LNNSEIIAVLDHFNNVEKKKLKKGYTKVKNKLNEARVLACMLPHVPRVRDSQRASPCVLEPQAHNAEKSQQGTNENNKSRTLQIRMRGAQVFEYCCKHNIPEKGNMFFYKPI
jgi:hypothetical protein